MAAFHMNLKQTGEANRSDGYTQYQRCRLRSSSAWLKKLCNSEINTNFILILASLFLNFYTTIANKKVPLSKVRREV